MRDLLSRWVRARAVLAGAGVLALVAFLLPASPAHALPSGESWSASWSYYDLDAFSYQGTMPGASMFGFSGDAGGNRQANGYVMDTADDGLCARVFLVAVPGGLVADETACGRTASRNYSTGGFNGVLVVFLQLVIPNTTQHVKSFPVWIPGTAEDPRLREVGSGASWSYYTGIDFTYSVTRPGVRVYGIGSHQPDDRRSASSIVTKTSYTNGCATARHYADGGGTPGGGAACTPNATASFLSYDLSALIRVEACYDENFAGKRCTFVLVPQPA